MNKKAVSIVAGLVVVAGIGGAIITKTAGAKQDDNKAQVLKLSTTAPLDTIDISKATGYGQSGNVFESFYRLGNNGKPTAGLAKSSQVSKDGKTWTFKLRDAKWSNGDKITANDFVYSWRRTLNPKTKSEYAYLFDDVKNATTINQGKKDASTLGIKALDSKTVQIQLDKPLAYFKVLMAYPLFGPQNQKVVEKYGKKYATKSQYMVYSGPFKIEKWNGTRNTWEYVKNDKYWDKDKVKLSKITYNVEASNATGLSLYQQGKLDLTPLSIEQIKNYKDNSEFKQYPYSVINYLKYNFKNTDAAKRKAVSNRNTRLAISLSLNRQQLTKKVLGDGSTTPTGFVPTDVASDPKNGEDFAKEQYVKNTVDYNPTLAKQYWEKGLKQIGAKKVSLTLLAGNDDPETSTITQYLKAQLEKELPGFTLNVKAVPGQVANQLGTKGEFDVSLSGWGADFNDPISHLQIPEAGTPYNTGKYNNATYNKLIDKATNADANDTQKRWNDLVQASQELSKDQGMTPLYQQNTAYLQKAHLHGVIHNTAGTQWNYKYAYIK
ncbi:peptide ABC transporter substrate-binding protein [Lentilactobacillus sp. Marseille-Q4993]|uniref:peptide ABC transporter substrate-binding protein n=1 Tax=Lentilactobacillus sp. Marseille-Q4993 TaxID=3039492 RepID=UPI0024BCE346|nr:peptide ABC transporter substrate-binding protein [Lentilactobacillus sp. Marseille-Q4993]